MIGSIFSRISILTFGTSYPAYYSFKAVRANSVDECKEWMMYWIVFAMFSVAETFTDVFFSWLPFYYELKIFLIMWLLPPMGNGSPIIYRNCLYPFLNKHESRIDRTLVQMKDKGQDMLFHYVTTAVLYIARMVMNVVHKTVPNSVIGMSVNHPYAVERRSPPQDSPVMICEEEEEDTITMAKVTKRKATGRTATKDAYDMDALPSSSRSRGRRTRHAKLNLDLDVNLNES